ncbi:MAG: hypothetical protein DRO13_04980, partial [Thermoprotei archaeon]
SVKDIVLALMIPILLSLLSVNLIHSYVIGIELALVITLLMLIVSSSIVMVIEDFIEAKINVRTNTYIRMLLLTALFLISIFIVVPILSSSGLMINMAFLETLSNLFRFVFIYTAMLCIASIAFHIVKMIVKVKAKQSLA